jgi:C-terminal processing protease CtpA/Prc
MNTDRLAQVCKLWGRIKYLHPYLAYKEIDWDAALVNALPKIMASSDTASYAKAVGEMLEALQDPATRIERQQPEQHESDEPPATSSLNDDGILLVKINMGLPWTQFERVERAFTEISSQLEHAGAVIFDLRHNGDTVARSFDTEFMQSGLATTLCNTEVYAPGRRHRMHQGFPPQNGVSADYSASFITRDGQRFWTGQSPIPRPIVFVVNNRSSLPGIALALQDAGLAAIIAEGPIGDESAVITERIELEEEFTVHFRVEELIYTDGTSGVQANLTVEKLDTADIALEAALKLVSDFKPTPIKRSHVPAQGRQHIDNPYPEMTFPNLEYRLLAVFRAWNVFEIFFPYKDLMDRNWIDVLHEFIPRFIEASDARGYALTVTEMLTHTQDSHVGYFSSETRRITDGPRLALRLKFVQGEYVISEMLDSSIQQSALERGDIIVSIDDEPVEIRVKLFRKVFSVSTPQAFRDITAQALLNGSDQTTIQLGLKTATNESKHVTLEVNRETASGFYDEPRRNGPVFKLLDDQIGYADLDRLEPTEVNEMFELFKGTRAIIFDMRGYPKGGAWAVAPRLAERTQIPVAKVQQLRVLPNFDSQENPDQQFDIIFQNLPPRAHAPYLGKTVMLIDERAISAAEHMGLWFKAANITFLVGSATTGANGDITGFWMPGNGWAVFDSISISHTDGKQLQRVGLIPDLEVHPTIQGIREGRDEILEAAIGYLNGVLEK